jgi:hypothetical protein
MGSCYPGLSPSGLSYACDVSVRRACCLRLRSRRESGKTPVASPYGDAARKSWEHAQDDLRRETNASRLTPLSSKGGTPAQKWLRSETPSPDEDA